MPDDLSGLSNRDIIIKLHERMENFMREHKESTTAHHERLNNHAERIKFLEYAKAKLVGAMGTITALGGFAEWFLHAKH